MAGVMDSTSKRKRIKSSVFVTETHFESNTNKYSRAETCGERLTAEKHQHVLYVIRRRGVVNVIIGVECSVLILSIETAAIPPAQKSSEC